MAVVTERDAYGEEASAEQRVQQTGRAVRVKSEVLAAYAALTKGKVGPLNAR